MVQDVYNLNTKRPSWTPNGTVEWVGGSMAPSSEAIPGSFLRARAHRDHLNVGVAGKGGHKDTGRQGRDCSTRLNILAKSISPRPADQGLPRACKMGHHSRAPQAACVRTGTDDDGDRDRTIGLTPDPESTRAVAHEATLGASPSPALYMGSRRLTEDEAGR